MKENKTAEETWVLNDSILVETPSLREKFGRKSACWEERTEPIFRFWSNENQCFGFPFFPLFWSAYQPETETVSLYFPLGTIFVRGPKAVHFYNAFCAQRATLLKADSKDVLNVTFIRREEEQAAAIDAENDPGPDR